MITQPRRVASRTPLLTRGVLSICSLLCFTLILAPSLRAQLSGVSDASATQPGTIEGTLVVRNTNRPAVGVTVTLRESGTSVTTDERGQFRFDSVVPGTYTIVATGANWGRTRITDVVVRPGGELSLSRQQVVARGANYEPLELEEYVVSARKEGVLELDPYDVQGRREKPFASNMDIPRTINDAQPYYIFDATTIDRSGATDIEDFLKQRLTMNTTAQSNALNPGAASTPNTSGNTSAINLRGLGVESTLILINGRRAAGVNTNGISLQQPDLNGIPLSAIERIEVLPSSASGIYGASAIGGVVNVILKKNFRGGEIRATYENTWDTDAPRRSVSLSYGSSLEDGKTHLTLSASWSDYKAMLLKDRRELMDRGVNAILANFPGYLYSNINPFLGALPNITANTSAATTLTLKDGTVIPSRRTFIPAGTSPSTATSILYANLLANGGQWDFNLPASTQSTTGLFRPLGVNPTTRSVASTLRRQFGPNLEAFAEYTRNESRTATIYNPNSAFFTVSQASPHNPFNSAVRVRVPDPAQLPLKTESKAESFTIGAIASLPWEWVAELDYTRSRSEFSRLHYLTDTFALNADLNAGVINPFVDTLMYPLDLAKYTVPNVFAGASTIDDVNLRGSGPLAELAWGTPTLTVGLGRRVASTPENYTNRSYPVSTFLSQRYHYFERKDVVGSGYAELTLPLIKRERFSLVRSLELQAAGRIERFTADTGSSYSITYFDRDPVEVVYEEPTVNGQPYRSRASYKSKNTTLGIKYQPSEAITLRTSIATAFLPPAPFQLVRSPAPDAFPATVFDPQTNALVDVETISGGNPALKPQNSKSWNAGFIWQPRGGHLEGLRLNVEYYRIEQFDAVGSLSAQQIVDQEANYPGRVTRDASGAITRVDVSYVNLFRLETDGWDVSVDYRKATPLGTFSAQVTGSFLLHLKTQYALTEPAYDGAGYPADGGAAKVKVNGALVWEKDQWTAGWSTRYFGPYKQFGTPGGPLSMQYVGGAVWGSTVAAQGGEDLPSQIYHDIFLSYAFGKLEAGEGAWRRAGMRLFSGMSVQLGIKNVFNTWPPFDAGFSFYTSPYGDPRLRTYSVSLRKEF